MVKMDRYKFCEENKEYLLGFLQKVKSAKNKKYCDLMKHHTLNKIISIDVKLQNEFNSMNNWNVIDITESDEDETIDGVEHLPVFENSLKESSKTNSQPISDYAVDDKLHIIKESLQMGECLSSTILTNLNELNYDRNNIFNLLLEELNLEEVLKFGISLKTTTVCKDLVVTHYVRCLLIEKLTLEYSDQLQELLNDFSIGYPEILLEELTQILLHKEAYSKVFLQFLEGLKMDFKQKLLSQFLNTCGKLYESYISVIEILIVPQADYDTFSKLVAVLSNSENNINTNKSFGKLLINVIKILGKNVILLEQPLKQIIGSHRSVWKSKLQKTIDECLQENSILSQSIRY